MVVDENKHHMKVGKKGPKEKVVDCFSKKDWYYVKALVFSQYFLYEIHISYMKTLVMRTQGTKTVSDGLKGHVFEVSLSDLQNDEVAFRKSRLVLEIVQGKNSLTNFHGMDLFDFLLGTKGWVGNYLSKLCLIRHKLILIFLG